MKFGAMNFPIKPIMEEIEKIQNLGFGYLELTLDPPFAHWSLIDNQARQITKILTRHNLGLVCHLPTFVYTADLSMAIRKASLDEMVHSMKTAARLQAAKVVLHPAMSGGLGPMVPQMVEKLADESLGILVKEAEALKLQICLENMFPRYHFCFLPKSFERIFTLFPDLKLCLDTDHANIDDPGQERLSDFIHRFSDRIGHVHISDNLGKKDDHFSVGQGNINFKKFIEQLSCAGYDDTMTLEIFSPDPSDLVSSREKIISLG